MSVCTWPLPQPPLLTLLVIAMDEEEQIGSAVAALHRLCGARGLPHEILVVENGSVDNTGAALLLMARTVPALRVHRIARRVSRAEALREGLYKAGGRYVALCGVEAARAAAGPAAEAIERALYLLDGGYELVAAEADAAERDLRGFGALLVSGLRRGIETVLGRQPRAAPLLFAPRDRALALAEGLSGQEPEEAILALARDRRHRVAELIFPR